MRNPLGKSCALQATLALVSGDDGAFELPMGVIELSLIGDDLLVEGPKSHDIGFKPPVISSLDRIKEGSKARGRPLKGFVDPMG